MNKKIHTVYKEYPEQPYISESRDVEDWIHHPEKYPYSLVEKKQMIRLKEGILPGDLILLWRIHFGNFTNETWIPEYFEYRYGINSHESIKLLLDLNYIDILPMKESLSMFNTRQLKDFLKLKKLDLNGKKQELIERIQDNFSEAELQQLSSMYVYHSSELGIKLLEKYQDIIKQHGTKS